MTSRFASTFTRLRASGACGVFPWLMAGYPDVATSRELAIACIEAGADGFEIGIPHNDPLADGPTMQRVNQLALGEDAGLQTALDLAQFVRKTEPSMPIAVMSYCNPILQRGETQVAELLAESGVDALIVADLPLEEASDLRAALHASDLSLISLAAPTSSGDRLHRIGRDAEAFVYCVSLVGVTGARAELSQETGDLLERLRAATGVPLVVGFGISTPEHVRAVAAYGADGVIVASALAELILTSPEPVQAVHHLIAEMKAAAAWLVPQESPGGQWLATNESLHV